MDYSSLTGQQHYQPVGVHLLHNAVIQWCPVFLPCKMSGARLVFRMDPSHGSNPAHGAHPARAQSSRHGWDLGLLHGASPAEAQFDHTKPAEGWSGFTAVALLRSDLAAQALEI